MAESTICKVKRDGTITFYDDGRTNSYEVSFEAGDFSATVPGRTVNVFLDRGVMADPPCLRYGDDQPVTGTFTAQLRDATDATIEALADFITQTGFVSSNWTSTLGTNAEVFTVEISFAFVGTALGDTSDHGWDFDHCYITGSVAEGDPSTLTINWTSYSVYPTPT